MKQKKRTKRIVQIALGSILTAVVLLWGILSLYAADYYHADLIAESYLESDGDVTVTEERDRIFFDGPGTETAVIFYPGAKVEYRAYAPMMKMLAEQDVDCFLMKMPYNLANFGVQKAKEVVAENTYPDWYLMGHSLGGAMAAEYAAKHAGELKGLILLAAYPASSLKDSNLKILSIYGTKDEVLQFDKLKEGREKMPEDYSEIALEGGNHGDFGAYGPQRGDGEAEISREEQWKETVAAILEYIRQ